VIEESPSPLLTDVRRRRITAAAVAVAQAAGYRNAGTVEFLVEASRADADAPFYFLEMNTRLQVEHPVTEEITGLDLVRAQLIVAAGQPLPWAQRDVSQRGHAIEARVYAEDPSNGFIPQAGRLAEYIEPRAPGVRVDSGVAARSEIPVHYDPMIAKVIATAESRSLAIARLSAALKAFAVGGVRTNLQFLIRVLALQEFHDGRLDTSFLDREAARLVEHDAESRIESTTPDAGHAGASEPRHESSREWDPWTGGAAAAPTSTRRTTVHRPRRSTGSQQALSAPMPATVIRVDVKEGDKVRKGDVVVLLEAMKMELPVRAPADAVVRAVRCRDGELVDADAILVELA
jgi:3-methylcrotonyl-CoA carboxylase alpha subunit